MSNWYYYGHAIAKGCSIKKIMAELYARSGGYNGGRGGSYGHTKGLWHEFGADRVIDTPITEQGFTGMAAGAAATGLRPIVDLMFAEMLFNAMSPICHQAGKLSYMSNGGLKVPLVIRAQMGGRTTGPHHSGCFYSVFVHVPGFVVVAPSNPADAKGLMKASIRTENPVIFFEHKFLYTMKGEVPEHERVTPLGAAAVVRKGRDVTVVAISSMVGKAVAVADSGRIDADIEIIDPRTLNPLDMGTIVESVRKTGRLIVVEEGHLSCGVGAEIAAQVNHYAFGSLIAPVERLASRNIPHPFSPVLEASMIPGEEEIEAAIRRTLRHRPAPVEAVVAHATPNR